MEERYIASVDLGSSKIALTVAKIDRDNIQVLYYRETPSKGVRYSCVFNPGQASKAIADAISQAEEELRIKIRQVVAGLPRYNVRQEKNPGRLERTDPESCITQEEVDSLKNFAMDDYPLDNEKDEKVFGAVAQSFTTDDQIRIPEKDVVGAVSKILDGNFKIFIGRRAEVRNLEKAFQMNGITVARSWFLPDVTADAVLSPEEKENGVALVDLGAGASSVTIFQNGIMRHYGAIPFGASNITEDIRSECAFSDSLAENIKLAFGGCLPDKLQSLGEKILQINDDEDGSNKQLSVKYLSEIITARQREIFDSILYEIGISGYADRLRNGVVLTGGGANLMNCANLLKEMSGYTVRIGFPRQKHFSAVDCPAISETSATASVGMLLRARSEDWLNCIDEPIPAEEPAAEDKDQEPDLGGSVFDPDAAKDPEAKPAPKPRKQRKTPNIKFIKKLSDTFGSLYDTLEG